jgi:hypothetical protein
LPSPELFFRLLLISFFFLYSLFLKSNLFFFNLGFFSAFLVLLDHLLSIYLLTEVYYHRPSVFGEKQLVRREKGLKFAELFLKNIFCQ